jgi:hypothetical protein
VAGTFARVVGTSSFALLIVLVLTTRAWSEPASSARSWPHTRLDTTADLDGTYLWIGPGGGAARIDGSWYSSFGGTATVVRVRERAWLGVTGASVGAARWTVRGGGRVWLDGMLGTRRLVGATLGTSLGPMLELGDDHHPKIGMSGTIWVFAGVVPYVRLGVIDAAGGFLEAGVQLSLPAWRW